MRKVELKAVAAGMALLLASLPLGGAGAQSQSASDAHEKTVLELFTSQGCSSCPTADALLKSYMDRPDTIVLSFSVDYWDYLGWKDTLADPKYSRRQRLYAKMRGDGRIYTPQVVVNGLAHANGGHAGDIDQAIVRTRGKLAGEHVAISVSAAEDQLTIHTGAAIEGDKPREGTVWLAVVQKEAQVRVRSGENHGRMLTYYNVVRDLKPVGTWTGRPSTIKLDRAAVMKPDTQACAVLLQVAQTGPIIGAAYLPNW